MTWSLHVAAPASFASAGTVQHGGDEPEDLSHTAEDTVLDSVAKEKSSLEQIAKVTNSLDEMLWSSDAREHDLACKTTRTIGDVAAGVEARTVDHTLADVIGQISHAGERPVGAEWVGGEYGGHVY